ncbi:hypothetical protein P3X46_010338 [Hevea brasiliensis]|uniref:Uncharacterized protein n=1 Tax=Hevea brasiliensis TaxID=3981 RepID=A0ABQ9MDR3_HEVBR|nr:hypothetical protein P3X46_010338 [Hevea brasiliensis]
MTCQSPIVSWNALFQKEIDQLDQPSTSQTPPEQLSPNDLQVWLAGLINHPQLCQSLRDSLPEGQPKKLLTQACSQEAEREIIVQNQKTLSQKPLSQIVSTPKLVPSTDLTLKSNEPVVSQNFSQNSGSAFNWILKDSYQSILTVEDGFYDSNPRLCAAKFFGSWHFKPWDKSKNPAYYQSILIETGSVKIKHFLENSPVPNYSTCTILKVIHPANWGQDLSVPKKFQARFGQSLPSTTTFTYWDYHQAWINAFLIQNPSNCHTWLFFFQTVSKFHFPRWFDQWWNWMGAIPEILPSEINQGYTAFKAHHKPTTEEDIFHPLILFASKFFLPWVLSWDYGYKNDQLLQGPVLIRKFKIRWWSKFQKHQKASLEVVEQWLLKQPKEQRQLPSTSAQNPTTFLAQKSNAQSLLAQAKSEEEYFTIMQQLLSNRSSTSKTPSQASSSSDVVSLGNDNEDDCFGILSALKHQ